MAGRPRSKKAQAPELEDGDIVVSICDDAAYLSLLDVESYDKDFPDWDYPSLTKKVVREMNAGHIVAWGCPEVEVNVRLTRKALGKRDAAKVLATTSATLTTSGSLCLAGYTSLTMCAQFEDHDFPQPLDQAVRVAPGTYRVDVHRLFDHRAGEQFPELDELPEGDHYVVVLQPLEAGTQKPRPHRDVAWAPKIE